jgi:hypothetical protein
VSAPIKIAFIPAFSNNSTICLPRRLSITSNGRDHHLNYYVTTGRYPSHGGCGVYKCFVPGSNLDLRFQSHWQCGERLFSINIALIINGGSYYW